MADEPEIKRVVAFFDGQNVFHSAQRAFGYKYPNFDPKLLAEQVVSQQPGWTLHAIRFYTGIHDMGVNPFWNQFWTAKLAVMGTRGIVTFTRKLRYQRQTLPLPDGSIQTVHVGQEKGIDLRIALDMVRMARANEFDVALVFSQDQDLSEAVDEVRAISVEQARWIKVACAFPFSPGANRGIERSQWIRISKADYDPCIDHNDYRPKNSGTHTQ